jgi:hypothetical protein
MCDFFSWIEICDQEKVRKENKLIKGLKDNYRFLSSPVRSKNKIYYLTDDIITATYGEDACIEDMVGHEAIMKFFRKEVLGIRNGIHRESMDYIDPRIVAEINNGDMRKMLKAFNPLILEVRYDSKGRIIKKVTKFDNNNPFIVGQYYKWVGSQNRPGNWHSGGAMDAMLSGKPFKALRVKGSDVLFDGIPRMGDQGWNGNQDWAWRLTYTNGAIVRCDASGAVIDKESIVTTYYTYICGIRFSNSVSE